MTLSTTVEILKYIWKNCVQFYRREFQLRPYKDFEQQIYVNILWRKHDYT
jgi:hypothetical protein